MRKPLIMLLKVIGDPHSYDGKGSATVKVTQRCFTVRPAYSKVEYTMELNRVAEMVMWRVARQNAEIARRG